jgi:thiol-disulfide isomerase/thioredoxin
MTLSKKAKSNLIFYGIAGVLIFFLFFTSAGGAFRAWMMSFTLRTPDVQTSEVKSQEKQFIEMDWMVISDSGNEFWLSDTDKPIFINIWATWCGPCRSEMGSILDLQKRLGDKVEFLLVSTTEKKEIISKYKKSEGIEIPLYVNGSVMPNNIKSKVFPTTFIVDKNKKIVYKWEGAYNWNDDKIYNLMLGLSKE